jgi:hypothetical protein
VNRFQSKTKIIALAEKALLPLFLKLGWRSDLTLKELLQYDGVEFVREERMVRGDLYSIVTLRSLKPKPIVTDVLPPEAKARVPLRVL